MHLRLEDVQCMTTDRGGLGGHARGVGAAGGDVPPRQRRRGGDVGKRQQFRCDFGWFDALPAGTGKRVTAGEQIPQDEKLGV